MFISFDNYWIDSDTFPVIGLSVFSTETEEGVSIVLFGVGVNIGINKGGQNEPKRA